MKYAPIVVATLNYFSCQLNLWSPANVTFNSSTLCQDVATRLGTRESAVQIKYNLQYNTITNSMSVIVDQESTELSSSSITIEMTPNAVLDLLLKSNRLYEDSEISTQTIFAIFDFSHSRIHTMCI